MTIVAREQHLSVSKHQVEEFTIALGEPGVLGVGTVISLNRTQAREVWERLGEELGIKAVTQSDCGSRMAHEAHMNNDKTYCSGRSRDMT